MKENVVGMSVVEWLYVISFLAPPASLLLLLAASAIGGFQSAKEDAPDGV